MEYSPDLQSILASQNPWWKTGTVALESKPIKRELFEKLWAELDNRKITAIIGPRRSGKTYVIHQLIDKLLKGGVEKERIIYLQIEVYLNRKNLIAEVMDFIKIMLKEPPSEFKSKVYFFIDEAHKLAGWADEAKYWHDLNLKNLKIVVSGSSGLNILKGAGESLIGRANHIILLPLSFREFLSAKYGIETQNRGIETAEEIYKKHFSDIEKIEIAFQDYLHAGGYPSVAGKNAHDAFQNLLEYKDLALQRDIFELEEIRDAKNLNEMVFVLSSLIGNRLNYSKIGNLVGIKVHSVKKYIGLLEDIFLLRELMVYSKKPYFSVRKERKICFIDTGMANALNNNLEVPAAFVPALAENAVSAHILRKRFEYEINPTHYYWVSDTGEIDVVALKDGKTYPVEVKYQNEIYDCDKKTLLEFMEKFGQNEGIVVTKRLFKKEKIDGKEILLIPAWLFMMAF